jgi:hypothetical protein
MGDASDEPFWPDRRSVFALKNRGPGVRPEPRQGLTRANAPRGELDDPPVCRPYNSLPLRFEKASLDRPRIDLFGGYAGVEEAVEQRPTAHEATAYE